MRSFMRLKQGNFWISLNCDIGENCCSGVCTRCQVLVYSNCEIYITELRHRHQSILGGRPGSLFTQYKATAAAQLSVDCAGTGSTQHQAPQHWPLVLRMSGDVT